MLHSLKVSIITPFFNAEKFLSASIQSVLNQEYTNWELLLINDGSSDKSKQIVFSFLDDRIIYFEQENKGVSAARNAGLCNMTGDYFCFLDSDDILPRNSLSSRVEIMKQQSDVDFVDGTVIKFDQNLKDQQYSWYPDFEGYPLKDLIRLTGKSFMGLSWMIRRRKDNFYKFNEELTHLEDLLFFLELCRTGGKYAFTSEIILHYRDSPNSAMKNLTGLENGYRFTLNQIKSWVEIERKDLKLFNYRFRRAMFLSYLRTFKVKKAINILIK